MEGSGQWGFKREDIEGKEGGMRNTLKKKKRRRKRGIGEKMTLRRDQCRKKTSLFRQEPELLSLNRPLRSFCGAMMLGPFI